ncbi:hypothetical protein Tco_0449607 [Tanacetum coccineum]
MLTMASRGKKKSTPLLIPSIRFTKLIIHHLKTKHNIHPRTGSPLHYSHEDNVLGTLRSVGKDEPPVTTHQSSAWIISDTRDKPSGSSVHHLSPPNDQKLNNDSVLTNEEHSSGDDDLGIVLKVLSHKDWWKPHDDDERPATPEPAWVIPTSHIPDVFQMEECHKMLTDQIDWANLEDLDYLRYGSKGSGQALSISKMKATHYPDFGLELLVPEHMWGNDVCTYDISASYGISHWWFNRQKFYIDFHTADSSRKVVRTHMRILNVVKIKAYYRYGYDYLKEITLRRADYQEYTIAKKDFKNLFPSDFEDLNLLLLQGSVNGHGPHSSGTPLLVPPMTTLVIDLTTSHQTLQTFMLHFQHQQQQQHVTNNNKFPHHPSTQQSTTDRFLQCIAKDVDEIVTDAVDWALQAPLRARFSGLLK